MLLHKGLPARKGGATGESLIEGTILQVFLCAASWGDLSSQVLLTGFYEMRSSNRMRSLYSMSSFHVSHQQLPFTATKLPMSSLHTSQEQHPCFHKQPPCLHEQPLSRLFTVRCPRPSAGPASARIHDRGKMMKARARAIALAMRPLFLSVVKVACSGPRRPTACGPPPAKLLWAHLLT
eukprot:1157266-Pelagomonas_calceolata.AAC.7